MQQNLLNAEFVSVSYLNAWNKNMHVIRVIKAPTKESRQVPGSAGKLLLHICLLSIALFGSIVFDFLR